MFIIRLFLPWCRISSLHKQQYINHLNRTKKNSLQMRKNNQPLNIDVFTHRYNITAVISANRA